MKRENKPLSFPLQGKVSKTNRDNRKCPCCGLWFDGPGKRHHLMEVNQVMLEEGYCPNTVGFESALAVARSARS